MSQSGDCTVHVTLADGAQIVHDAGSRVWLYRHGAVSSEMSLARAATYAHPRIGGVWHEGAPGGAAFDAAVRAMLSRCRQDGRP